MSNFNISPQFRAMRAEKLKKISRRRMIIAISSVATVLVSVAIVLSLILIPGSHRNNPDPTESIQTALTPGSTDDTALTPGSTDDTKPSPVGTGNSTNQVPAIKQSTTVFIDAGHGALNSTGVLDVGTGEGSPYYNKSNGKYEDQLNLEVALKLRDKFKEAGYTVIMFREDRLNQYKTVNDRAAMANGTYADVFISIHANSTTATTACGTRILYYANRSDSSKCLDLANTVKKKIDEYGSDLSQRPVQIMNQDTYVIRFTKIPAILVETCFLTNEKDAEMAISEEWQSNMASAIFNGVSEKYPLQHFN